ncbi:MAG: hypothetical protein ACI9K2_005819 [Myxococcota bacterium]|jgi:hypothetical protein
MNTVAFGASVASALWVTGVIVQYFSRIAEARVPVEITALVLKLLLGVVVAATAVVWSVQSGSPSAWVMVPAVYATMMAVMILWLLTQRKTPVGELRVEVGDKLLAFGATTSDGVAFHTDQLAGKRTLLKFFRGGW